MAGVGEQKKQKDGRSRRMAGTRVGAGMQGKIIKGIGGFYYVHVEGAGVYECRAKGIFRKDKKKPLVGDNVEITVLDQEKMVGNVELLLPRKNELIRPAAANVDHDPARSGQCGSGVGGICRRQSQAQLKSSGSFSHLHGAAADSGSHLFQQVRSGIGTGNAGVWPSVRKLRMSGVFYQRVLQGRAG